MRVRSPQRALESVVRSEASTRKWKWVLWIEKWTKRNQPVWLLPGRSRASLKQRKQASRTPGCRRLGMPSTTRVVACTGTLPDTSARFRCETPELGLFFLPPPLRRPPRSRSKVSCSERGSLFLMALLWHHFVARSRGIKTSSCPMHESYATVAASTPAHRDVPASRPPGAAQRSGGASWGVRRPPTLEGDADAARAGKAAGGVHA